MPKRKLEEAQEQSLPSSSSTIPSRHHDRITGQLEHSKIALSRALKIARGFERQKLGRRQKTAAAEKKLDDMRRLKLEVAELKELDLEDTAETHLFKGLLKIKAIASCNGLPAFVWERAKRERKKESAESLNVQARLFKAETVRMAVNEAVDGVRAALGIPMEEKGTRKRLRAKDYSKEEVGMASNTPESGDEGHSVSKDDEGEELEWDGFSSPGDSLSNFPVHVENDFTSEVDSDDDRYDRYAARLADSASSDSESEQFSSAQQRHNLIPPSQNNFEPPNSEPSISPSPSPSSSPHPQSYTPSINLRPKPRRPPPSHPTKPTTTTTFIPSLLTSGYYSGDSSASSASSIIDGGGPPSVPATAARRKNRMGQQARRALWEKKFKDRANHLVRGGRGSQGVAVGRKGESMRDEKGGGEREGWDGRRGATFQTAGAGTDGDDNVNAGRGVDGSRGRGRGRGRSGRGGGGGRGGIEGATGANGESVGVRGGRGGGSGERADNRASRRRKVRDTAAAGAGDENDGSLHPSWEAARKAKEAKKTAKPVGRKVVF